MSQTIKIKRTTGTGKDTAVDQGELFYAYGTGGTYGKRLAIGHVNGGGNTPEIIGGAFFTDMLDHTEGALTASSAILVDSNKKLDELKIGNTTSAGQIEIYEATNSGTNKLTLKAPSAISNDISYTLPGTLTDGHFLKTDANGNLTFAAVGGTLTVGADSGSNDTVTIGSDTLTFAGTSNEIETTVSDNQIQIGLPNNVTISGNLTVSGTTTTVSSTTLTVTDPLLSLAKDNGSSDAIDIGFYGLYDTGGTDKYTGFFRDATNGKYRLFKDLQAEPGTTVDTTGTGYAVGTLIAHLEDSSVSITGGSITGITDLAVADGGTGLSTIAKGSILAANSANTLTAVDGGGSTDKMLLYTASSDTISWSNSIDGGTYS